MIQKDVTALQTRSHNTVLLCSQEEHRAMEEAVPLGETLTLLSLLLCGQFYVSAEVFSAPWTVCVFTSTLSYPNDCLL